MPFVSSGMKKKKTEELFEFEWLHLFATKQILGAHKSTNADKRSFNFFLMAFFQRGMITRGYI